MKCPRCNKPLEDGAAFCGHCGALLKPRSGAEVATVGDVPDNAPTILTRPNSIQPATADPQSHNQNDIQSTVYADREPFSAPPNVRQEQRAQPNNIASQRQQPYTPPFQPPVQSGQGRRKLFISLLLAVVIVGAAIAGTILFTRPKPAPSPSATATGQVNFFDSQTSVSGNSNSFKITTSGMSNPPAGYQYNAWLFDTDNEQFFLLGTLSKQGTSFNLASNQPGTNLIGKGNKIEITQEQGQVSGPTGKLILSGVFPPNAFIHIRHLLSGFPTTPGQIGLLVGSLNETQKLNTQASLLQNNLGNDKAQVRQCLAQSIVDISEGANGADYKPLPDVCATQNIMETGDGFGLLDPGPTATNHGYIATAFNHAILAASATDATDTIRNQAKKVEACTDSIKALVQQINGDALQLLANPSATAQVAEIVSRSDHAYHGFDQNGNGTIEPIVGEAGAVTAYTQGQLMATLTLS